MKKNQRRRTASFHLQPFGPARRVESTQKQINQRINGTKKFWCDESLEPRLQLKADDLSETHDREAFWKRRGIRNDGFRHRRRKTKLQES